jgi:hypothetical protein
VRTGHSPPASRRLPSPPSSRGEPVVLDPGSPRHGGSCRALLDVQEVRIRRKTADRVSSLSAGPPRDALRSLAPPASFTVDELQRCGTEHSAGEQCLAAALASHGRGHRFDPCHAHQHKRLPGTPLRRLLPADYEQWLLQRLECRPFRLVEDASRSRSPVRDRISRPVGPGRSGLTTRSPGCSVSANSAACHPAERVGHGGACSGARR